MLTHDICMNNSCVYRVWCCEDLNSISVCLMLLQRRRNTSYGLGRGRVSQPVVQESWDAGVSSQLNGMTITNSNIDTSGWEEDWDSPSQQPQQQQTGRVGAAWEDNWNAPSQPQLLQSRRDNNQGWQDDEWGGSSSKTSGPRITNPSPNVTRVFVPSNLCGRIIGKGGSKIRELQDQTGCRINVSYIELDSLLFCNIVNPCKELYHWLTVRSLTIG